MRHSSAGNPLPELLLVDSQANIEGLTLVAGDEGAMAYADDLPQPGWYTGAVWNWLEDLGYFTDLVVENNAVDTASSYEGIYSEHRKTAGATGATDDFFGLELLTVMDQAAGEVRYFDGIVQELWLKDGTVSDVDIFYSLVNIDGGTVGDDVFGGHIFLDIEAAATITGDIYGQYIEVDTVCDPTGDVYSLYLKETAGVDYGVYQDGSADNVLGGNLTISTIIAGVADYDKFLVSDGGLVKFRTGVEVLSDIGAAAAGSISGTAGRIAQFGAGGDTVVDSNIVPPANLLTLIAGAPYTLTVPATGTAALLGTANVFTAAQRINVNSATALVVEQNGVWNNTLVVNTANGRIGAGTAPRVAGLDVSNFISAGDAVGWQLATRTFNAVSAGAVVRVARVHDTNAPAIELLTVPSGTPTVYKHWWDMFIDPVAAFFAVRERYYDGGLLDTMHFRIEHGGNVLIGTTTDNGQQLQVHQVGRQLGLYGGAADYATFAVATDGELVITTVGTVAALADITLSPDGHVNINSDLVLPKTSGYGIKVDTAAPTFGWQDLLGNITNAGGANKPTRTTYIGGIDQYLFSAGDEAILEFHIPHDYVPGSDIYIHVHWSHISTLVTGGTVTFTAESTYAKGHNQAPFSAPATGTFVGTASTTQYQHILSETQYSASAPAGLQLDTDDLEVDGVILVRLEMTTNNITSSGAVPDPFIHYVDVHYQSTGIATKAKAPDFYT